jgi:CO/xanthine dehydrogenase Mo-binding subunit
MPTAAEVPPVESVVLELLRDNPKPSNPLGAKGVGEIGVVGIPAAAANAVAAAVGGGDVLLSLPLGPDAVSAALAHGS